MNDMRKTKAQLVAELNAARRTIAQLESVAGQLRAAHRSGPASAADPGRPMSPARGGVATSPDQQQWFRALAEKTDDIVYRFAVDPPGYTYVSPSSGRVTGYTPEELYENPGITWHVVNADGRRKFQDLFAGRIDWATRIVFGGTHKDGRTIGLENQAVPIWGPSGDLAAVEGVLRDVSARKKAEEALRASEALLRALVDNLPFDFWAMDVDGRYVMQNAANKRNWGDLIGRGLDSVSITPEIRAVWGEQDRRVMAGEIVEVEYQVEKDGKICVFHKTMAPVREGDHVTGIVCVSFDVTDRVRLEKEILEVSARVQRRIGQDLHDDLGQHLVGVLYLAQSLAGELRAQSPPTEAKVTEIADLVKEALVMTRNLARGLRPVGVASGGLVAALKELASVTEKLFEITCRVRCEPAADVADDTIAEHLYHIAQEAISNAVKHGKPRTIEIALTSEHGRKALRISDDGVGLPKDLDPEEGMGLRIMSHRSRMIDGWLDIGTRSDGGTIVSCYF